MCLYDLAPRTSHHFLPPLFSQSSTRPLPVPHFLFKVFAVTDSPTVTPFPVDIYMTFPPPRLLL